MPRRYFFDLPYTITGLQDIYGVNELKSAGLWEQVPYRVQTKMLSGEGFFGSGAVITKDDLDALPEAVWTYIAKRLGLAWRNV